MVGPTIDRYRVIEQLGQGGMGVVFKARDTLLDRLVALKVLAPDRSGDPDHRRRFLQEAKAASALNHPGIVSVHDVLTVDGQDVLVMELVEGETLEQLLARRRLPLGEALGLAIGVADALARAHTAGIVHRDLKPSNVMVTADGVKVLDFGLAKLAGTQLPSPEAPTIAPDELSLTRERVLLGTVPWMSPEQASGRPVDARSDIFAFGSLLYEMLTGHHPFRRRTTLETLEAIREQDPAPPSRLTPALPPEVDRAVLRCLRKDPPKRWQGLSDLCSVLQDLKEDSESGRRLVVEAVQTRRRRFGLIATGTLVLAVLALAAAVAVLRRRSPPAPPLDLRRLTYDGGFSAFPAISSDGTLIAYASDRAGDGQTDIWVRHINQPEPARLTHDPADEWMPRFSPDGSRLVFRSERAGGGLYLVNTFGGEPHKLVSGGIFPRFSPDGTRILYLDHPGYSASGLSRMFVVPADGGEPLPLLPDFGASTPPASSGALWSPDGTRVMFRGAPFADPGKRDWWVAPSIGGEPAPTGAMESLPRIDIVQFPFAWLPDRVLFLAGTTIEGVNLYSAAVSSEGRITGPVRTLTSGPGMTWTPSVSDDGRIAFSKFQMVFRLWQAEIDPSTGRAAEPRAITADAAQKFSFSLDRDGSLLAFSTFSGPRERRLTEVRLRDLENGLETVLVSTQARTISLEPRLSPDGTLLAWCDLVDRQRSALVAPVVEPAGRELCRDCQVLAFFADGAEVLLWKAPNLLVRRRLADGPETPVLDPGELEILDADLSWDDRWVAVSVADPTGRVSIHLVPVRDPPARLQEGVELTDGSGWVGSPRWSPDGRLVYYLSDRDDFTCVWACPVDPTSRRPVGEPFPVLHAHQNTMKVFPLMKGAFAVRVGARRLVMNAVELTGEIYTATLD